jgi:hypothetical protein
MRNDSAAQICITNEQRIATVTYGTTFRDKRSRCVWAVFRSRYLQGSTIRADSDRATLELSFPT